MRTCVITAVCLIAVVATVGCYAALILSSQISRAEERRGREAPPDPEREKTIEALHDDGKRYSGLLEDDVYD